MPWFITAIVGKEISERTSYYHPKEKRTFGFFNDPVECKKAVVENLGNMHEFLYNYIVVEKIPEGIHSRVEESYWWKWSCDQPIPRWEPIPEKPEQFEGITNWALG